VRIVRLPVCAPTWRARQYKYFIRYTDWNICSICIDMARIAQGRGSVALAARETMSQQAATEPPESFDDFQRRLIEIEPHLPKRLRQAAAYAL
jgi:hypothetical protein